MTEEKQEATQEPVLDENGQYLKSVVDRFNEAPDTLTVTEKVLMEQIVEVSKALGEVQQQLQTLQQEIQERQQNVQTLLQQANHGNGQLQALQTALLKLKPASE